jgi:phage baseplate assembly protein W
MARTFSVQDGNLSTSIITSTRFKVYKDIDLSFTAKPNGEIYKKQDAAAVRQAVKNILMTNFAERPFNPNFGANLRSMLFELADADAEYDIERRVLSSIQRLEPRAKVLNVRAVSRPDNNEVTVTTTFQVISTSEEITFTTTLARLR